MLLRANKRASDQHKPAVSGLRHHLGALVRRGVRRFDKIIRPDPDVRRDPVASHSRSRTLYERVPPNWLTTRAKLTREQRANRGENMYIGVGAVVLILVIVLVVFLMRR